MRLTIIGATGSMSGPQSPASCYLVRAKGPDPKTGEQREWSIALEMGPGSFGALWRHIDPRDLDALVLSHTHADHMADIISLQVHRRWGPGAGLDPLLLAGPIGTLERIRQIDGTRLPDDYAKEFSIRTVRAGHAYRVGPMTLRPYPGVHTVEAFGTRIEGPAESDPERTVSMFFTGDTDEAPAIERGASGVDLLLSEVGFTAADEVRGIHMDGARAGRLATRAGVGRLVATHIQPWTDPRVVEAELRTEYSGRLDFAVSDAEFTVGE